MPPSPIGVHECDPWVARAGHVGCSVFAPTTLLNFGARYNVNPDLTLAVDVFNLGQPRWERHRVLLRVVHGGPIRCACGPDGVNDRHIHPAEPTSVRLSARLQLKAPFGAGRRRARSCVVDHAERRRAFREMRRRHCRRLAARRTAGRRPRSWLTARSSRSHSKQAEGRAWQEPAGCGALRPPRVPAEQCRSWNSSAH